MTSFVCHIPPIEGAICFLVFGMKESPFVQLRHCACISAIKTLFKYNLKETIYIYYLIEQYLKHEKYLAENCALKAKSDAHFSRGYRQASKTREEQTGANSQKPASVCSSLRLVGEDTLYCNRRCARQLRWFAARAIKYKDTFLIHIFKFVLVF